MFEHLKMPRQILKQIEDNNVNANPYIKAVRVANQHFSSNSTVLLL